MASENTVSTYLQKLGVRVPKNQVRRIHLLQNKNEWSDQAYARHPRYIFSCLQAYGTSFTL